jgi:hypothetical protein
MTQRAPGPALQRSQRKQDLLLVSQLARHQAMGAFDELAGPADALAYRVASLRTWLSSPQGLTVGSAAGALALALALRRGRVARVLRWGWLAWRLWRSARPALRQIRAGS